jgi:hypothetical protein
MRLRGGAFIAVGLAALALAATAQAAPRYAAPGGGGPKAECPQGNPCSLKDAVEGAKANDEVIIGSGAYTPSGNVFLPFEATGVNVHGDPSGPPPTITSSASTYALGIFGPKSRLSYVDVTDLAETSAAINCGIEVSVERVRATSKAKNGWGLQQGICAVRDSLIRAEGEESVGLLTTCEGPVLARNLTIVATGSKSVGAEVAYNGLIGDNCTLLLRNSIVSGDLYDLNLYFGGIKPGNVTADHSNFDIVNQGPNTSFTQGPGNQTAAPLFVNAAGGDYREAAGSPTVDAGTAEGASATDLDGNPRILGSSPDIGAFESLPTPVAALAQPAQITSLRVSPTRFHPAKSAPVRSCFQRYADRIPGPRCAKVGFELTAPGTATFTVEQRLPGRRAGGKCRRPVPANARNPRCVRFRNLPGVLRRDGAAEANSFTFSGWLGQKRLKAGRYRLLGEAGGTIKRAAFRITG